MVLRRYNYANGRPRMLKESSFRVLTMAMVAILALTSGCKSSDQIASQKLPRTLPVPPGLYAGVVWLNNGWIAVEYWTTTNGAFSLWKLRPDDSEFGKIPLASDPSCHRTSFSDPIALPNGSLGMVKWCFGPGIHLYLESYSLESGRIAPLLTDELPFNPHQVTLAPGMHSGFISTLSDICGTIAALTPSGVRPLHEEITADGRTWRLDEYFMQGPEGSCSSQGRADWPALSPDGSRVAFFASPPVPGVRDFGRLDLPWILLVTNPDSLATRADLSGVRHPRGLSWSPDGRWLAFAGQLEGRGTGTWLFGASTQRVVRVSDIAVDSLAWSPDGRRIVGVFNPDTSQFPPDGQLLVFDVAASISF